MDSTQNIISFCTGYGGIELGLKLAGAKVRTVAYVEIEAFACANLVAKIEQGEMDAAPIWSDIKTFDGKPFRRKVHGIIGGYPCQPFSNAGKRKGTDDPRHLWPYILEHIRAIKPIWCFFENVSGHLTLGFEEVFKSLRGLDYKVEAGLFTAAEVGAPHKRERLFILAYAECVGGREGLSQVKGDIQRQELPAGKPYDRNTVRSDVTRCGELGNPNGQHRRSQPEGWNNDAEAGSAGQELANSNLQPDGQDTRGDAETDSVQEVSGQEICRGGIARTGEQPRNWRMLRHLKEQGFAIERCDEKERWHIGDGCVNRQGLIEFYEQELADCNRAGCEEQRRPEPVRQEHTTVECGGAGNRMGQEEKGPGGNRDDTLRLRSCVSGELHEPLPGMQGRDGNDNLSGVGGLWPARPGQPQYDFEEPRTVEPGMGRAVNGFACRVDELRLLGNGVVPQTAALAFRELWEKTAKKKVKKA